MKFLIFTFFTLLIRLTFALPATSNNVTSLQVESMRQIAAFTQNSQSLDISPNATEDGLSGPCKPITMIFAKGTGENGNVGDGSSPGPAWIAEMRKTRGLDMIAVQGVPYNADVEGYLIGGDPEGSERFLNITNLAVEKCPNTRLVIGGYSQGAQLAHNAAMSFSPDVTSRVDAAVVFGDPKKSQPLGDIPPMKVLSICHDGDIICNYIGGSAPHLTYSQDAAKAASFAMTQLQQSSISRV
ncbi:putative cutinase [Erysiphe necator]|uniref:Cutinase n=1 Tax=Uncinula necator TaxID=52586 RepID=A0A0B1P9F8_UNCNE|nr:putative cutinase [Erysiphe necator]